MTIPQYGNNRNNIQFLCRAYVLWTTSVNGIFPVEGLLIWVLTSLTEGVERGELSISVHCQDRLRQDKHHLWGTSLQLRNVTWTWFNYMFKMEPQGKATKPARMIVERINMWLWFILKMGLSTIYGILLLVKPLVTRVTSSVNPSYPT